MKKTACIYQTAVCSAQSIIDRSRHYSQSNRPGHHIKWLKQIQIKCKCWVTQFYFISFLVHCNICVHNFIDSMAKPLNLMIILLISDTIFEIYDLETLSDTRVMCVCVCVTCHFHQCKYSINVMATNVCLCVVQMNEWNVVQSQFRSILLTSYEGSSKDNDKRRQFIFLSRQYQVCENLMKLK